MDVALRWIESQQGVMAERLSSWCAIGSGTLEQGGVERVGGAVEPVLRGLADTVERVAGVGWERVGDDGATSLVELVPVWVARKRVDAPVRVLLNIHLDTVYPAGCGFDSVQRVGDRWIGPGVADAKGGLVVMLTALEALERSDAARTGKLGWTVLLNGDEEVGSPGSAAVLVEEAQRHDVGLLYEPALPDGRLVSARKGSGNFAVVFSGRPAHAGRDFFQGCNAVQHAASLAMKLASLSGRATGITVNIAKIAGGGANNVVPDRAVLRFNVRVVTVAQQHAFEAQLRGMIGAARACDDRLSVELHGSFLGPPKPMSPKVAALLAQLQDVGDALGITHGNSIVSDATSGGVCDGNKLASAGLTVVDTLGPVGGKLHTVGEEYAVVDSFVQRAQLSAGLLLSYARGGRVPPTPA